MPEQRNDFYRPHSRVITEVVGPSMTKQSFKNECDIHTILKQFQKTGIIEHINSQQPMFDDLPSDMDYQSSLHLLMEAEASFQALPSKVREHFNNDPALFLGAFNDEAQRPQLIEWGLITPPPPDRPPDPQAVPPTETKNEN